MKKIIIAIDGPAASGKSTVAKIVASKLGYKYIDSGAMYRCVALYAINNNLDEKQLEENLNKINIEFDEKNNVYLNNQDVTLKIRSNEVTNIVPQIAKNAKIRSYLVQQQQKLGATKGIVMDGRDIGTVVFTNAELKIYQIASATARATRRHKENIEKNIPSDLKEITKEIEQRDYQDMNREHSPLTKAKDALILDTSNMTIEQSADAVIKLAEERVK
ncbi:(d)CMP kinase [Mycoplasma sp. P36-A1]|uniref:(d)CMP kinase n=1 Tax=Mycoplasma sp. P36-A1 TaxID=3252900 RepID=UPI003C2F13A3